MTDQPLPEDVAAEMAAGSEPVDGAAVPYLQSVEKFVHAYVRSLQANGSQLNVMELAIGRQLEAVHTEVLVTYLIDMKLLDLAELRKRLIAKLEETGARMSGPKIILGH